MTGHVNTQRLVDHLDDPAVLTQTMNWFQGETRWHASPACPTGETGAEIAGSLLEGSSRICKECLLSAWETHPDLRDDYFCATLLAGINEHLDALDRALAAGASLHEMRPHLRALRTAQDDIIDMESPNTFRAMEATRERISHTQKNVTEGLIARAGESHALAIDTYEQHELWRGVTTVVGRQWGGDAHSQGAALEALRKADELTLVAVYDPAEHWMLSGPFGDLVTAAPLLRSDRTEYLLWAPLSVAVALSAIAQTLVGGPEINAHTCSERSAAETAAVLWDPADPEATLNGIADAVKAARALNA